MTLHSNVLVKLEDVQHGLTRDVTESIKSNQVSVADLSETHGTLVAPLIGVKTNQIFGTPRGSERHEGKEMSTAIPEFEAMLGSAASELEKLWAS
jgi:hypothetical protein